MTSLVTDNVHVKSSLTLMTPEIVKGANPLTDTLAAEIESHRRVVRDIINGTDDRLLMIVGPCSIHDVEAAVDYAKNLKVAADKYSDTIYVVMRVYFEKPRTTVGWKGLINDPDLDGSFNIETGINVARKLMLDITEIGLPIATEALDPIIPQYLQDLVSWTAIGARTTESQTHREMASGISSPVGFKNGTDGNLKVAIDAMKSAGSPHCFLGMNSHGQISIVDTMGNPNSHIVLRGGEGKPNFDAVHIAKAEMELVKSGYDPVLVVDCSHANSQKNHELQPLVSNDLVNQILDGNKSIRGMMIESNINAGNQKLVADKSDLEYGVSITDKCLSWEDTEVCLANVCEKLRYVLRGRNELLKVV